MILGNECAASATTRLTAQESEPGSGGSMVADLADCYVLEGSGFRTRELGGPSALPEHLGYLLELDVDRILRPLVDRFSSLGSARPIGFGRGRGGGHRSARGSSTSLGIGRTPGA
jgi:hypothetical protein